MNLEPFFFRFTCGAYDVYRVFSWILYIQSIVWAQSCNGKELNSFSNFLSVFKHPIGVKLIILLLILQHAAGGILGFVVGMLVETVLFMIRTSSQDCKKTTFTTSILKKNQQIFVSNSLQILVFLQLLGITCLHECLFI